MLRTWNTNWRRKSYPNVKKRRVHTDLEDFTSRVRIGKEQMVLLIRINAFRFTGKPKKELLWEAHMLLGESKITDPGPELFRVSTKKFELPSLEQSIIEDAYDEIELLGFPVSMSYFDMLKTNFRGEILSRDLMKYLGRKVRMVGNLVTIKNVIHDKKRIHAFRHFSGL
jgi:DNA polymerase III alpha subunit